MIIQFFIRFDILANLTSRRTQFNLYLVCLRTVFVNLLILILIRGNKFHLQGCPNALSFPISIVPEAGRAEAGTWKNRIPISTIPAQRAGLQGHFNALSLFL